MKMVEQREDITARVKERSDIVRIIGEHIELKRSGARFLGLCPFHGEKTPSFTVHPGQQFFYCFGCGESGDVFSFVMKHHHVDFPGALKILAEKLQIELPQPRQSREEKIRSQRRKALFAVNEKAADLFHTFLAEHRDGEAARKYLRQRGVSRQIIKNFRIGYAPAVESSGWNYLGSRFSREEMEGAIEAGLVVKKEQGGTYDRFRDRIVFPILDLAGQVCGFGGRIVGEGQPKYLNSPESLIYNKSRLLLGLFQQKESIRKLNRAILVEGNFDLISLVAGGCENVVAPLGTALTREQLRLIKRFTEEVTLLFDGDGAGMKAAVRAVPLFLAEQIAGRVALLPSSHDPDTYIREYGLAELNRLLEGAQGLPEFLLERLVEEHGLSFDGKRKIVGELAPLVTAAASPLQRSVLLSHCAEKLGMPVEELGRFLSEPLNKPTPEAKAPAVMADIAPLTLAQKQLLEYMILHPQDFKTLTEHRIRDCLAGTIGEILFLELGRLLQENDQVEPEELLTVLADGAERLFVVRLLQQPPGRAVEQDDDGPSGELEDLLGYLQKNVLQKDSSSLLLRIATAQKDNDSELLQQLLGEQIAVTRRLHGE